MKKFLTALVVTTLFFNISETGLNKKENSTRTHTIQNITAKPKQSKKLINGTFEW